ncbi:subtilisin-like serine protease PR1C [Ophiocordyceps camponoti-floridani]|uniref:Subtilisin-like serine protease PR1C n=1 Tax=Ophiocordyceps camponoti-floridani TaxID=2030778 RepID=A0A8H4QCT5_9HYPO|nr:subtilisin-like serine protease PR1C [Ophiocordyceps camponoti-floridani]
MFRFHLPVGLSRVLLFTCLSTASAIQAAEQDAIAPAVLLVECESRETVSKVHDVVKGWGVVRHEFDTDYLQAISFQLASDDVDRRMPLLEKMEGVKEVQKLERMDPPAEEDVSESQRLNRRHAGKRMRNKAHEMMQINKMHARGFKGSGIRIAVIDYTLPMFGGCFGPGCRVSFGQNMIWDREGDDPLDCNGHGTAVAAVLAGFDPDSGYVGAAPNATLGSFRITDCMGSGHLDTALAGWIAAFQAKPDLIVSSQTLTSGADWPQTPLPRLISAFAKRGVPCITSFGNSGAGGLFQGEGPATGSEVIGVGSYPLAEKSEGRRSRWSQVNRMANFSSYGPAWDTSLKPDLAAPGEGIVVPGLDGGFVVDWGTSLSAPLVAGVAALVMEARRKRKEERHRLPLERLIRPLLMATAAPQKAASGRFISVAGQGGGLVRALDAATTVTIVYPASLAFNDTENRSRSIEVFVLNTGQSAVKYRLANIPAEAEGIFGAKFAAAADICVSNNATMVVQPGSFGKFTVSASDPTGLPQRLVVWSGWLAINGSDGSYLTVPYLGMAGSMRSASDSRPNLLSLVSFADGGSAPTHENPTFILPDPSSGQQFRPIVCPEEAVSDYPGAIIFVNFGTPVMSVSVVPLDYCPDDVEDEACGQKPKLDEFPLLGVGRYLGRQRQEFQWTGELASGKAAPPGKYKFVVQSLPINSEGSDWRVVESPWFSIVYKHMCESVVYGGSIRESPFTGGWARLQKV